MAKRAMQWAEIDGRQRLLVGGKVNRFIPNPTFDPVAKPGSLDEYFRGKNPERRTFGPCSATSSPSGPSTAIATPAWRSWTTGHRRLLPVPDARRGHGGSTGRRSGCLVAAFQAFNRWLEDDWGYAYKERIFAAPMITLVDVDAAVAELRRVLEATPASSASRAARRTRRAVHLSS